MTVTVRYRMSADSDLDLNADFDVDLVPNLSVAVREMRPHRPSRWAFDLFDTRNGRRFESTFPFVSPEQAVYGGLARLEELNRLVSETSKRLVIVSADDAELVASLRRLFAGRQRVEIVSDRRRQLIPMDRRIPDRRAMPASEEPRSRGWWISPGDSARSA